MQITFGTLVDIIRELPTHGVATETLSNMDPEHIFGWLSLEGVFSPHVSANGWIIVDAELTCKLIQAFPFSVGLRPSQIIQIIETHYISEEVFLEFQVLPISDGSVN